MPIPTRLLPTTGWQFIRVVDLTRDDPDCEVRVQCSRCHRELRYVHHLRHPDWPKVILVGLCCALKLAGIHVEQHEREARNRASRRQRFLDPSKWKRNPAKGSLTRVVRGTRVTVYPASWGYGFFTGQVRSNEIYLSEGEALCAAFDQLENQK